MSEMPHVLVQTTRADPTKHVDRTLAPGNRRHVILSNGVRLTRQGSRKRTLPLSLAVENSEILAAAIERGVIKVFTPEQKLMGADDVRGLSGAAPKKAAPAPKPEAAPEPTPEPVVDEPPPAPEPEVEPEPDPEPESEKKKSVPKGKRGKKAKE